MSTSIRGVGAGVPFIAVPPTNSPESAPIVVLWHLMDPPSTIEAFAASLPLDGLDAWRIYLGLPMTGDRLPEGGFEELMQLGYDDAVSNIQGPISRHGADELPAALADIREQLGARGEQVAFVGGSMGSAVAALAALETAGDMTGTLAGLVMISPISRLRNAVAAVGKRYGISYEWTADTTAIADRLDFVARAAEFDVPLQIVVGADDGPDGFVAPARELHEAVAGSDLVIIDDMGHALAEEPGIEAAPQTAYAARVDKAVTGWLRALVG